MAKRAATETATVAILTCGCIVHAECDKRRAGPVYKTAYRLRCEVKNVPLPVKVGHQCGNAWCHLFHGGKRIEQWMTENDYALEG